LSRLRIKIASDANVGFRSAKARPFAERKATLAIRNPHSTIFAMVLFCLATSGCAGYQLGSRSLYRPDIRTVHVPVIESVSYRRYLGERLTEALVKDIELNTPYTVVGAAEADSILTCRIVSESKRVLAEDRFDQTRDVEADFFVQVSWVDRRGDLIMSHNDIPVQPLLLNISQSANFVAEGGQSLATAHQEAIYRLADQIRGHMELAW
jgi:hypothetical protein